MLARHALDAIGRTPLVRLEAFEPAGGAEIWIKVEAGNPTGSYKDRMAVSVLRRAMERGALRRGDRVVEYTGGSTGTALAFACAVLGLKFTAVFSDAFSESKKLAMEAFGAQVLVERWRRHYNTVRPHSSLGYRPPAPETILPPAYGLPYAPLRPAQLLATEGRVLT